MKLPTAKRTLLAGVLAIFVGLDGLGMAASHAQAHPAYVNGIPDEDCDNIAGYVGAQKYGIAHPDAYVGDYARALIALVEANLADHPGWRPEDVLRLCGEDEIQRAYGR